MKTINSLLLVLIAATLALAGCGKPKQDAAQANNPMTAVSTLQKALTPATPEIQTSLEKIFSSVRYGEYPPALAELEKLAANPSLNDAQKKSVSDATEQIKKFAAAVPPKPQ